jgi:hypothetical protein
MYLLQQETGDTSGWNWESSGDSFQIVNVKQEPDDKQHFCTWMDYGESRHALSLDETDVCKYHCS